MYMEIEDHGLQFFVIECQQGGKSTFHIGLYKCNFRNHTSFITSAEFGSQRTGFMMSDLYG